MSEQSYSNNHKLNLIMAAYLANDTYDYQPGTISATSVMKPVKQQVLARRVPEADNVIDVSRVVKSRIGTAVHDGVERVWVSGDYIRALSALGYPQEVVDKIVVNPGYAMGEDGQWHKVSDPDLTGQIPVYVEIRSSMEIDGYTVTGKFDSVADGRVGDIKTTSVFTWINQSKAEDYAIQGSIYRLLNPTIITDDYVNIHYVFTDWSAMKAKLDRNYPQSQVLTQAYPLWSPENTLDYVKGKLKLFETYRDAPEADMPECDSQQLWRKPTVYKYYKNPEKRTRATKNFDTLGAANLQLAKDKNVGVVIPVPGEVIACKFCPAFEVCTQKDRYLADGTLKLD